ncbi:MAG: helix-turn-helix transcriptional regulator [Alphaproteobacteria bacterium]|nr:helix-turn-helix transcriptional regulator [Alphaproteobacteria bacterium]
MVSDYRQEQIRYFRPPDLAGTELLSASRCACTWRVIEKTYAVCAVSAGGGDYHYRGGHYINGAKKLTFMEPGELHYTTVVYQPADFTVLFISPQEVEKFTAELGVPGTPHFGAQPIDDPALSDSIFRLYGVVQASETPLTQQSKFTACIRLILGHADRTVRPIRRPFEHCAVARIKSYLEENYSAPVTLDELSAVAGGMSRFWLIHAFTRNVGMPPHAYQLQCRIHRARTLLLKGMPLAQVATHCGFSDQSHFTRHFKRILNVTPGQYARDR